MTIKALKDGRYEVDIRPQGAEGKRIRKKFTLKSKAQDYEKYVLQNLHNSPWLEKPADKRRLSDLVERWWLLDGQTQAYGETYLQRLNKVIREMGDPRSGTLTRKFLLEYRASKLTAGLNPHTVNRDLTVLSAMFSVLIRAEEFYHKNPMHGIRKLRVPPSDMSFLSDDEIDSLLSQLGGDDKRIAILCLSTGARWGEAKRLRGENIVGNRVMFTLTKTNKPRAVPISEQALRLVKTQKTGPLFNVDYVKFRQILKQVKPDLPKGQATHVMRHTFATHFMMNGGNIITLQRILGHSNIQQTMVYAHFAPDFLQDAISFNPLAESVHKLSI
ncbi:TPA: tyrosine-type recombinase/integrase [Salmonella enterica]|nr:tyrosine-type recombinase/integrase [Salmonella enterica]